jgi:hypothetical protein
MNSEERIRADGPGVLPSEGEVNPRVEDWLRFIRSETQDAPGA